MSMLVVLVLALVMVLMLLSMLMFMSKSTSTLVEALEPHVTVGVNIIVHTRVNIDNDANLTLCSC